MKVGNKTAKVFQRIVIVFGGDGFRTGISVVVLVSCTGPSVFGQGAIHLTIRFNLRHDDGFCIIMKFKIFCKPISLVVADIGDFYPAAVCGNDCPNKLRFIGMGTDGKKK